ncbi:MAG: A24 family peptidase [Acidobacteriales bacterium]|nr:A24 family peptidase [Terriglobales bacterium]
MTPQVCIAVIVGLAASVEDIVRRRISNWIPVTALAAGLIFHTARDGWRGTLTALAGAASGLAVFLVFYLLGGMGGGDVKLMAGFGAVLGAGRLLEAALWTAAVGGLAAAAVIAWGAIRSRLRRGDGTAGPGFRAESIPYAPAITVGAWLALIPRG